MLFVEELIRIVMGLCLLAYPLLAVEQMISEPYCDVAYRDQSQLDVANPAHILCDVLLFFLRAFGWFNFAFGCFVEIGRRQLSQANNRTGWFVFICLLTHISGLVFEFLLKPKFATTSLASYWHASYTVLYSFCLFKYAK